MNYELESALESCLARLRNGERLDSCLADYPNIVEDLYPLLILAREIQSLPRPQAHPESVEAGRQKMLAALHAQQKNASGPAVNIIRHIERIPGLILGILLGKERHGLKLALRLAVVLLVVFVIGFQVTLAASANSLPGDTLYPLKRLWEQVRLSFTLDEQAYWDLQSQYAEERRREVQAVMQLHRRVVVEIDGTLETMRADTWVVNRFTIEVNNETIVEGSPEIGLWVSVRAQVQDDGALVALRVRVSERAGPIMPFTVEPTPPYTEVSTRFPSSPTPVPIIPSPSESLPTPITREPPSTGEPVTATPTVTDRVPTPIPQPSPPPTKTPPKMPTKTSTPPPTTARPLTPTPTGTATLTPTPFPTTTPTMTPTSYGGETVYIFGVVTAISSEMITVQSDGQSYEILITPITVIVGNPQVDDFVYVQAQREPSGALIALYIEVLPAPPRTITFYGVVTAISSEMITVQSDGQSYEILITPETVIVGEPQVDDTVYVEAQQEPSGTLIGLYIEVQDSPEIIYISGVVRIISSQMITMESGGQSYEILITPETVIVGSPQVGDSVSVIAQREPSGALIGLYVEVTVEPPKSAVSISGVVTAINDKTIAVESDGRAYEMLITPETTIVGSPQVGDSVYVEAQQEPSGALIALYVEVLRDLPEIIYIFGVVRTISGGMITVESGGPIYEVVITPMTAVVGNPQMGNSVYVEAQQEPGGTLIALYIEVVDGP